jgi:diacylglycerol kinase family enzyme
MLRAARPIAFQVDGEYLGQVEAVRFQFVPRALRVIALTSGADDGGASKM